MQHIRVYLRPQLPTVLTELLWRLTVARRLLGKRFVGCCGRYKKGCYFIFHTQNNLVATYFHGKFAFFFRHPTPRLIWIYDFLWCVAIATSHTNTQHRRQRRRCWRPSSACNALGSRVNKSKFLDRIGCATGFSVNKMGGGRMLYSHSLHNHVASVD